MMGIAPDFTLTLLNGSFDAESIQRNMSQEEWGSWLNIIKKQGLTVWFWQERREALKSSMPESIWDQWKEQVADARLRSASLHKVANEMGTWFEEEGIPFRFFKGADLAPLLYQDASLRPMADIDLLIDKVALSQTLNLLKQHGFDLPQSHLPIGLSSAFHYHIALHHERSGAMVEVHWDLGGQELKQCNLNDPLEYAVYLSCHIFRHTWSLPWIIQNEDNPDLLLHPWQDVKLIWFLDLKLFLNQFDLSQDSILDTAARLGVEGDVHAVLLMLHRIFPEVPCPSGSDQHPRSCLRTRLDKAIYKKLKSKNTGQKPWFMKLETMAHLRPVQILYRWF